MIPKDINESELSLEEVLDVVYLKKAAALGHKEAKKVLEKNGL